MVIILLHLLIKVVVFARLERRNIDLVQYVALIGLANVVSWTQSKFQQADHRYEVNQDGTVHEVLSDYGRNTMHIEELTKEASLHFLAGHQFGRLACARHSQPYITPFSFAYHDHFIYSFSTVGQKIEWLRANPLACAEVDEIAGPQQWTSVIVYGRYEELTETTDSQVGRELAHKLLHKHELWWEPGYSRTILHGTPRPLDPVYYRLSIDEISGHRATQD